MSAKRSFIAKTTRWKATLDTIVLTSQVKESPSRNQVRIKVHCYDTPRDMFVDHSYEMPSASLLPQERKWLTIHRDSMLIKQTEVNLDLVT